jgi:hypothetical protein
MIKTHRSAFLKPLFLSGLFVVLSTAAQAQDSGLSLDFNGGGGSFNSTCAPDHVLIGLEMIYHKKSVLESISLYAVQKLCRAVNGQGQWVGGDDRTDGPRLIVAPIDPLGIYTMIRCTPNMAVSRLDVISVDIVHDLRVYCSSLARNGTLTGGPVVAGTLGPMHILWDKPPSDLPCPGSLPARGIYGLRGFAIDRIGLQCRAPILPATVTFAKQTLRPGEGTVGVITLNRPNPNPVPLSILLTSNVAGVTIPTSVVIPPGTDRMPFGVSAPSGSTITTVTITAKLANGRGPGASAAFSVQP